jgi:hypothetical protein
MMSGDRAAAVKWVCTPRPEFGNKDCLEMIETGRGAEVEALIIGILH